MEVRAFAGLQDLENRADGGVNVYFRVMLDDYVVNVPMTLDEAPGSREEIEAMAKKRFHALAAALAQNTANWA